MLSPRLANWEASIHIITSCDPTCLTIKNKEVNHWQVKRKIYTRLKSKRKEKWLSEGNLTYRCITYRCHSLAFQQYMRLAILTLCQCSKNGPDQKVQPETNQYADWLNFIWTAGQSKWVLWFPVGSTDSYFTF
jgi:hypothetical protein